MSSTGSENPLLKAALDYVRRGWHVFPLHGIRDGRCTCGNPACERAGKHPRTGHGLHDATTDPQNIEAWWTQWPDANIGLRTGAVSGCFVLDVDGPEGEKSLAALMEKHGPMPQTAEVQTGRGRHLYFKHPGGTIPNSAGKLGAKLDIRGDGGYVILPPSIHCSGAKYIWGTRDA